MRVNIAMTPRHILQDERLLAPSERRNPGICCAVETVAGDCGRSMIERLRAIEAICQFGQRCTRGCAEAVLPGHAVVGLGAVQSGSVGDIAAAANGLEY